METLIIKFDKNNAAIHQILSGLTSMGAITVEQSLSPSGDPYWEVPENIVDLEEGLCEAKAGNFKPLSFEQLKRALEG